VYTSCFKPVEDIAHCILTDPRRAWDSVCDAGESPEQFIVVPSCDKKLPVVFLRIPVAELNCDLRLADAGQPEEKTRHRLRPRRAVDKAVVNAFEESLASDEMSVDSVVALRTSPVDRHAAQVSERRPSSFLEQATQRWKVRYGNADRAIVATGYNRGRICRGNMSGNMAVRGCPYCRPGALVRQKCF